MSNIQNESIQPLNLPQHTGSTAVFSAAVTTLVPVLITLCFAARALVVVGVVAARPRATCVVGAVVALRDVTVRDVVLVDVSPLGWAAATVGRVDRAGVVADGRVAPNAADTHAKTTNAKDNRFKRNPFYFSSYYTIKKWLVQVASGQ